MKNQNQSPNVRYRAVTRQNGKFSMTEMSMFSDFTNKEFSDHIQHSISTGTINPTSDRPIYVQYMDMNASAVVNHLIEGDVPRVGHPITWHEVYSELISCSLNSDNQFEEGEHIGILHLIDVDSQRDEYGGFSYEHITKTARFESSEELVDSNFPSREQTESMFNEIFN